MPELAEECSAGDVRGEGPQKLSGTLETGIRQDEEDCVEPTWRKAGAAIVCTHRPPSRRLTFSWAEREGEVTALRK